MDHVVLNHLLNFKFGHKYKLPNWNNNQFVIYKGVNYECIQHQVFLAEELDGSESYQPILDSWQEVN